MTKFLRGQRNEKWTILLMKYSPRKKKCRKNIHIQLPQPIYVIYKQDNEDHEIDKH